MYYNTNKETGKTLEDSKRKAETQEQAIHDFFKEHVVRLASPGWIAIRVFNDKIPLTSVRRAMTNLTNRGVLVKTEYMAEGRYGKMVHTWRLKA